jgi:hypothetical protein
MGWKPIPLIIVAVAVFVMALMGMGLMVPDDSIPDPIPNSTAADQAEMIRGIANFEFSALGWLGMGLIILSAIGIIVVYYGRLT